MAKSSFKVGTCNPVIGLFRMKEQLLLWFVTGLCLLFAAPASEASEAARISSYSQGFLDQAASGNQFEILSSRTALKKSNDAGVREFAQRMIDDHTQALEKMKSAMARAKADGALRDPGKALDARHQKILDILYNQSGPSFDRQYIDAQVKAHDETLKLFRDYSVNGDNLSLKEFAAGMLPALEKHRQHLDILARPR